MTESLVNWSSFICVGAGAAGALTAARLLDLAGRDRLALDVVLVDPGTTPGRGVAYSTTYDGHLLNVPARDMSAYPEDPDHLLRWLAVRGQRVEPSAFVPRRTYGRYLGDVLETAERRATRSTLTRIHQRAVGISIADGSCRVTLDSGSALDADGVVLALGHLGVSTDWAPESLRRSPRLIVDPWGPRGLGTVPDGDVLIVGTGLTMVDAVLALRDPQRLIHATSRSGELPRRHASKPLPVMPPPELPVGPTLKELRRAMTAHLAWARREYGDWRPAIDSIRPLTQRLWKQLSDVDKALFLAEDARLWDSLRHRVPPASADVLAGERQSGRLVTHRAHVVDAEPVGQQLRVTLSDESAVTVAAVVNCTGPSIDVTTSRDPLVRSLVDSGLARSGPFNLGFDTDDQGRLADADGAVHAPLWTLGSLRRGSLWESTAMPEIRHQVDALANQLVGRSSRSVSGVSAAAG